MPYARFPLDATVVAAVLGLVLAILPTCLYRYVEPRGRLSWGTRGDSRGTRRAPLLLRSTAWLSFAVGQLAVPWLVVPAVCACLLYLQAKLGIVRPFGFATTISLGTVALLQSLFAFRLLPLGVRLLMRDARLELGLLRRAKANAMTSALLLVSATLLGWAMRAGAGWMHPWLRAALVWSALRPVITYAVVMLLHAVMLHRCAIAVAQSRARSR